MKRMLGWMGPALLATLLLACVDPAPQPAPEPDEPAEIAKAATRADRRQFINDSLPLNAEQAKVFWPLYEEYQQDLDPLYDRVVTMNRIYLQEYGRFTDERARWLVDEYLALEAARLKLRQDYLPRFRAVLPETKVAAYYQLENKIHALFMYEAAMDVAPME